MNENKLQVMIYVSILSNDDDDSNSNLDILINKSDELTYGENLYKSKEIGTILYISQQTTKLIQQLYKAYMFKKVKFIYKNTVDFYEIPAIVTMI